MSALAAAEARLAGLEADANRAWWAMACDATDANAQAAETASAALEHALADPALADAAVPADDTPLEARRAEVLRLMTAGRRRPPALIDRIVLLETELMGLHSRYRAADGGRELDAAAVDRILQTSTDLAERERVWTSARGVGARALGHRDHYAMSLALDELDEDRLYALLDDLEVRLAAVWAEERARIAAERRAALGLPDDAPLRPWHLVVLFGQEPPSVGPDPLDPVIA
ncbi:MAG: hypothetical protein RL190_927, partial [Actinomycetota bacterium]